MLAKNVDFFGSFPFLEHQSKIGTIFFAFIDRCCPSKMREGNVSNFLGKIAQWLHDAWQNGFNVWCLKYRIDVKNIIENLSFHVSFWYNT